MPFHDLRHFLLVLLLSGIFWWLAQKIWIGVLPDIRARRWPSGIGIALFFLGIFAVLFYQAVVDFGSN